MKNIYIIGIGLIGGSLALNIKKLNPEAVIYGIDSNAEHLEEALSLNIIDVKAEIDDVKKADLVVLAIPVDTSVIELPKILDSVSDDALVIDVGSTKSDICKAIANHPKRRNFLATHPISGTEFSGPKAAFLELFQNKTNIICEVEQTAFKLQQKAIELFVNIGMRIRYMNPVAHDKHIAYMSHLSHISSFMLGKTVIDKEKNERDIFDMAGSGFESTVRLAKSSPEMWEPIFTQNVKDVTTALDEYIDHLKNFRDLISNNDKEELLYQMRRANEIRRILDQ